ncbi:mitotic checkpoint regulator, MAD2B-interacting-domain-containing protein [Tricharina praecox]|uniref:mitotic checkpoint regulator, MAD2B-interacting-domain-containing protein n=1 Tax=Tricharina praecox TaxID=43433 RepID=UPI00221E933D|nr:mitotic checkpoint regulator, MAD2B-interacting-domain-containing protein [Tricharina praecox]KAI5846143.1 mitotic checkpoint regulator, MAD2B-interacting-domain-containing protein [Tricharina praecox]
MDLDYASSDDESAPASAPVPAPPPPVPTKKPSGLSALLPKPKSRKQKDEAVDKDAPKKIIVNLPKFDDDEEEGRDGRPAKKARTTGSGLSAMLPAPKRTGGAAKGAAPPPPPEVKDEVRAEVGTVTEETQQQQPVSAMSASNTMFVPQSVARKPIQPMSAFRKKTVATAGGKAKTELVKPKVSLFGAAVTNPLPRPKAVKPVMAGEYKPIMLEAAQPMRRPAEHTDDFDEEQGMVGVAEQSSYAAGGGAAAANAQSQINDLDALAREAGLDESALRQLYGRHGPGGMPVKITTFSVDEEYRQNERDMEAGLAAEVKPVRTVAPGRHQLSSLLNVAQSQKAALEDSFARSKATRKESSSRYGW